MATTISSALPNKHVSLSTLVAKKTCEFQSRSLSSQKVRKGSRLPSQTSGVPSPLSAPASRSVLDGDVGPPPTHLANVEATTPQDGEVAGPSCADVTSSSSNPQASTSSSSNPQASTFKVLDGLKEMMAAANISFCPLPPSVPARRTESTFDSSRSHQKPNTKAGTLMPLKSSTSAGNTRIKAPSTVKPVVRAQAPQRATAVLRTTSPVTTTAIKAVPAPSRAISTMPRAIPAIKDAPTAAQKINTKAAPSSRLSNAPSKCAAAPSKRAASSAASKVAPAAQRVNTKPASSSKPTNAPSRGAAAPSKRAAPSAASKLAPAAPRPATVVKKTASLVPVPSNVAAVSRRAPGPTVSRTTTAIARPTIVRNTGTALTVSQSPPRFQRFQVPCPKPILKAKGAPKAGKNVRFTIRMESGPSGSAFHNSEEMDDSELPDMSAESLIIDEPLETLFKSFEAAKATKNVSADDFILEDIACEPLFMNYKPVQRTARKRRSSKHNSKGKTVESPLLDDTSFEAPLIGGDLEAGFRDFETFMAVAKPKCRGKTVESPLLDDTSFEAPLIGGDLEAGFNDFERFMTVVKPKSEGKGKARAFDDVLLLV